MRKVLLYTDGSCLGNPGPGGWAALLALPDMSYTREICGGYRRTTNNRMEILAVIKGLEALKEPCEVALYTDSRYVRDALMNGWLKKWRSNGWRSAQKKAVLNRDLWERLDPLLGRHDVICQWVEAHAGQAQNERCDLMARECAKKEGLPPDEAYEAQN